MNNNNLAIRNTRDFSFSAELASAFSWGPVVDIRLAAGRKDGAPTEVVSYYVGMGLPDFGGNSSITTGVKESPEEVQNIVRERTGKVIDITDQPIKNGFRKALRTLGL